MPSSAHTKAGSLPQRCGQCGGRIQRAPTFGWANQRQSDYAGNKNTDANTAANDVLKRLEELKTTIFPNDVDYLRYNQADFIKRSVWQLAITLFQGMVLVAAVTYFFLRRIPASVAVCGAIPFSLIITFIAMRLLGYTVNLMTLSALTVASGMVVDNAIVTTDQIIYHIEEESDERLLLCWEQAKWEAPSSPQR